MFTPNFAGTKSLIMKKIASLVKVRPHVLWYVICASFSKENLQTYLNISSKQPHSK